MEILVENPKETERVSDIMGKQKEMFRALFTTIKGQIISFYSGTYSKKEEPM